MPFMLPALPYSSDALAPVMSRETLELHHDKHHRAYVDKLNNLVRDTDLEEKSLEDLIVQIKSGDIFDNAAQAWNHNFFWKCMTPAGGGKPEGRLMAVIGRQFGGFENFAGQFTQAANSLFGSGWVWLARLANGALAIEKTANADNPLTHGHTPLLALDVWEHAYYLDYHNERARFVDAFWEVVNWDFVETQMARQNRPRPPLTRSFGDELRI